MILRGSLGDNPATAGRCPTCGRPLLDAALGVWSQLRRPAEVTVDMRTRTGSKSAHVWVRARGRGVKGGPAIACVKLLEDRYSCEAPATPPAGASATIRHAPDVPQGP